MANVDFEDDTKDAVEGFNGKGPLAVFDFRYKKMLGTESIPLSLDINGSDTLDSVPTEVRSGSRRLRNGTPRLEVQGSATFDMAYQLVGERLSFDKFGYRAQFQELIMMAKDIQQ